MTKRRASRFSSKKKKQEDTLAAPVRKSRIVSGDITFDWEAYAGELEDRLDKVRDWLDEIQDQMSGGMDRQSVIISGADLLLLRGILDDVVDLDEDLDEDD